MTHKWLRMDHSSRSMPSYHLLRLQSLTLTWDPMHKKRLPLAAQVGLARVLRIRTSPKTMVGNDGDYSRASSLQVPPKTVRKQARRKPRQQRHEAPHHLVTDPLKVRHQQPRSMELQDRHPLTEHCPSRSLLNGQKKHTVRSAVEIDGSIRPSFLFRPNFPSSLFNQTPSRTTVLSSLWV